MSSDAPTHFGNWTEPIQINASYRDLARVVAEQSDEDLARLRAVAEDAVQSGASQTAFAERVKQDVPSASAISQLLQQGASPLAAWLAVLISLIGLVMHFRSEHVNKPITAEQIEQIVERAVHEVEEGGDKPEPNQPSPSPRQQP